MRANEDFIALNEGGFCADHVPIKGHFHELVVFFGELTSS